MKPVTPFRHRLKLHRSPTQLHHRVLPPLHPAHRRMLHEREEESFERGRALAEEVLTGQIVSQRNEMLQLQNGVLKAINDSISQVVRETENTLIEIALTTAARLVADLPVNVEMIEAAIREALAQVEETASVHVLLHADDLALLKSGGSVLAAETGSGRLRLAPSPDVTRGGCVVRTHFGDIDGRRETKLEQMRKALTE